VSTVGMKPSGRKNTKDSVFISVRVSDKDTANEKASTDSLTIDTSGRELLLHTAQPDVDDVELRKKMFVIN
jgi:hypothetical protein